ncbi:membrane protein [Lentilactobacillus fungorum]|uniref:Membrane protein n=1 Tax=Lentilactobacillus fungorum TaxID=2201250 RepID=A0ABQ3W3B3_9LACO|nr:YoaK family protein [Lentilactobacillus fungorum]GHP14882.1 membrane protein [Lentilactobacillus fungorum]
MTGLRLGRGEYGDILQAVVSLLMFMVGVVIIRIVQYHYPEERVVRRRVITLTFEIGLFVAVSLVANRVSNLVTTGMLALAAASQLQEFRTLKNGPFTSLMMTGNVRTLAESLLDFFAQKNQRALKKAGDIATIISTFFVGALLNGYLVQYFHSQTILLSAIILLVAMIFGR